MRDTREIGINRPQSQLQVLKRFKVALNTHHMPSDRGRHYNFQCFSELHIIPSTVETASVNFNRTALESSLRPGQSQYSAVTGCCGRIETTLLQPGAIHRALKLQPLSVFNLHVNVYSACLD